MPKALVENQSLLEILILTNDRICLLLKKTSVLKRDYRGLAVKMKYGKDEIELFAECDNPTKSLLQE